MKIEYTGKNKKDSKHGNRFYTSVDMSIIKHDIAVRNAKIKRGEAERFGNEYIVVCGCGHEGCFIHNVYKTTETQEQHNQSLKIWKHKHH